MKMQSFRLRFIGLAVLAAGMLPALASPFPPVRFSVDLSATTLEWSARKVTGKHNGYVKLSSGDLVVDGNQIRQGQFEIDMTTITVEDIKDPGSNGKLLNHLKSDDFFSVDKFPKSTLVVTSVAPGSGDQVTVKGKLTIKGITNDVEFPATIRMNGNQMTASAKIKVDRTKYDIRYRSSNFFENLGDKAIFDDFEINVSLVATAR